MNCSIVENNAQKFEDWKFSVEKVLWVPIYNVYILISRYQKRCDELEVNRGNYNEKFEQLEKQKNDIVDYLKKEINKKSKFISCVCKCKKLPKSNQYQ